jgi:carbon storage regulator CsrA
MPMLVLSRKAGESVSVGEMLVKVVSIGQGRVRLAFEGPRRIPVVRSELPGLEPCESASAFAFRESNQNGS